MIGRRGWAGAHASVPLSPWLKPALSHHRSPQIITATYSNLVDPKRLSHAVATMLSQHLTRLSFAHELDAVNSERKVTGSGIPLDVLVQETGSATQMASTCNQKKRSNFRNFHENTKTLTSSKRIDGAVKAPSATL